ncbi:MAG TPA: cytochrome ubiquinol oxidase subunit I, partial [Longimicrobiales bacterium]|nr:cytochrome ubiquinol oxidase subunit I [Longimicrobiales bacterium]
AKTWAKATALTFAVGAVSGTALSFELGLLWPHFMALAGGVIGPAFALEGYAFFIEAIFLGLYLYGWDRLTPRQHWLTGIPVAVSGLMSGVLVVAANAWMQAPVGFELAADGTLASSHPLAPFQSPAWIHMAVHSSLSCYIATGFAVAGVYALGMLRGRTDAYHRSAIGIALAVGTVSALLQPLSGDWSAREMAEYQPAKLAAAEAHFETSSHVPLLIGGIPNEDGDVAFAIRIPNGLSLMMGRSPSHVVTGLDEFPRDERPPVLITHLAFQVMVGCGFALIGVGLWFWWNRRRRRDTERWMLRTVLIAAPLGFIALEAGWILSEVGRQPWVIYGVMRTADAVTPQADVPATLFGFTVLYIILGIALVALLRGLARHRHEDTEATHVA